MEEYEYDFDPKPINYRLIVLLLVCGIVTTFLFYPILFPAKPIQKIEPIKENVSTAIQIEYVTVYVTPIPDGKVYFSSEYQTGIRKINRPFSFIRENALGKKDLAIHANVYDYKVFNSYHWFNPTDYKYYQVYPTSANDKFVFVFFSIYSDDVIGDDTRFWIPTEKNIDLQVNEISYSPTNIIKSLRIMELENTYNEDDVLRVGAFNSERMYSASKEYAKTAGETTTSIDVLKGGKSNKIDGYILFEIPKDSKDTDMLFGCNFYSWGNSQWRLKVE